MKNITNAHHLLLKIGTILMSAALTLHANATEVYKWTDANGQVHFGDRPSASSNGTKIDVKAPLANEPPPEQRAASKPIDSSQAKAPSSPKGPKSKSKPADPSKIGPGCQDLIGQISKVKPGENWQSLYQRFNATCPGISYECNNYRTHPENNNCAWVERTGSNVLQTNNHE